MNIHLYQKITTRDGERLALSLLLLGSILGLLHTATPQNRRRRVGGCAMGRINLVSMGILLL